MPSDLHPSLESIQKWLFHYIVAPVAGRDLALECANDASGFSGASADTLLLPSHSLEPIERISIYRKMYLLRMEEALEIDFPVMQAFLGSDRFNHLVEQYVCEYPSRSWTLNHLGGNLAAFLDAQALFGPRLQPLLTDLARLEWALCEAFDCPETPSLNVETVAAVAPQDLWRLRLHPRTSLRLLSLRYPVAAMLADHRQDRKPTRPRRRDSFMAVVRRDYVVRTVALERAEYHLLCAITTGQELGGAIDQTLARRRISQSRIFGWFSTWVGQGFFEGLSLASASPAL